MDDSATKPGRIIVADNHPLFRVALVDLLREHSGLEVVAEATQGRQALELCRRFEPDLVVMDVRLPEVTGPEATRAIKRELPHTGVLLLSDYEDPDLVGEVIEAGASGYVLKTATPQQMIGAIREALKGAQWPLNRKLAMELEDIQLPPGYSLELDSVVLTVRGPDGESVSTLGLRGASKDAVEKAARESGSEERAAPEERAAADVTVLTPRQRQVVELAAEGLSNAHIAGRLYLTESTVKQHLRAAYKRLGVSNRVEAANRIRAGLALLAGSVNAAGQL